MNGLSKLMTPQYIKYFNKLPFVADKEVLNSFSACCHSLLLQNGDSINRAGAEIKKKCYGVCKHITEFIDSGLYKKMLRRFSADELFFLLCYMSREDKIELFAQSGEIGIILNLLRTKHLF